VSEESVFICGKDGFIAQSESVEAARSITGKVLVRRLDEFRPRIVTFARDSRVR